ncbi:MAG TPA: putative zinc-binding metallopeptidase [Alphaproteobacteria bacterium]|jgi:hypothetical protein
MARRFPWASLPDNQLLQLRIKDLKLTLEGTWLEDCLHELHNELEERGLRFKPHAWISDEWFSPDTTPGIAFPFYLAHPRLMRLERKKIIDVEGGTVAECMRILRHEAGHALRTAYQLQRRRQWQKLFGPSSRRYPSYYRPNPASKSFVEHLRLWYAQSHPDEDFAETFAVWLKPRSDWRKRYAGWPALKKLEYVEELMGEIADERPTVRAKLRVDPLGGITRTLDEHYRRKQAHYLVEPSKAYDKDLLRLFSSAPQHARGLAASSFIVQNRAEIRPLVSKWTGEYQLTLDSILDDMIVRCRELKLRVVGSKRQVLMDFTVLVTAQTVHSLYSPSRRQWYAL